MTTSTAVKTQGTTLLAHTQQATAVVTVGSAIDVSSKFAGRIFVHMGRTVATALTNQVKYRLEGSAKASGLDQWYPILEWQSINGTTASSSSTVNDASFNAGDTSFTITSATGIAAGDIIYLRETGTPANSEWVRVASVSGTTITLEQATERNHTNGIAASDLGELHSFDVDLSSVGRVRLVVDTASGASGQTVDVEAYIVTLDSISTV
jgi:hypothetical protein